MKPNPDPVLRKKFDSKGRPRWGDKSNLNRCMSFIDNLLDLQYDISEEELGRGKYRIRNRGDGRGGSALDPKPGTINLPDSLWDEINILKQDVGWRKYKHPGAYFDDSDTGKEPSD